MLNVSSYQRMSMEQQKSAISLFYPLKYYVYKVFTVLLVGFMDSLGVSSGKYLPT
jgi:hypothetical protein